MRHYFMNNVVEAVHHSGRLGKSGKSALYPTGYT